MALTNNPIVITGTGDAYNGGKTIKITGIVVNASADTWSVILKNGSGGTVIYQATQPLVNDRHKSFAPCKPLEVSAITATTLTNITNVLVYFDPS